MFVFSPPLWLHSCAQKACLTSTCTCQKNQSHSQKGQTLKTTVHSESVYCPKITPECNINQKIINNRKYFTSVSIQHAHNMPSQLGISTEVKESVGLIKHTQFSNKLNLDLFSSRWHLNTQENPLCTPLKTLRSFYSAAFSRVQCVCLINIMALFHSLKVDHEPLNVNSSLKKYFVVFFVVSSSSLDVGCGCGVGWGGGGIQRGGKRRGVRQSLMRMNFVCCLMKLTLTGIFISVMPTGPSLFIVPFIVSAVLQ